MKKALVVLLFISGSLAYAQQSPKPFGNTGFNYAKTSPNSVKHALNMEPFKLEDFIQNTNALNEFLRESNNQRQIPSNNMPIFSPQGKYFLEFYEVEDNIDHKLKIFDLEKSKYGLRNLG